MRATATPAIGAIDAHAHVFRLDLPRAAHRRYEPRAEASPERFLALLDRNAIAGAVLVQPSFLGTDNAFLLATLAAHPQRLRGVAVVEADVADDRLSALVAAGVVGVRLNCVGAAIPDLGAPRWQRWLARVAARPLHVELHGESRDLPALVPPLLAHGIDVVIDHFGRPGPRADDDPGFDFLLRCGASGKVWVKLSAPYRFADPVPVVPVATIAARLVDAFGTHRLVWGSDWPHTQFESRTTYEDSLGVLSTWLPDPDDRRVVLEDAPAQLFGFGRERTAIASR